MPAKFGSHMSMAGGHDWAVRAAHAVGFASVQVFTKDDSHAEDITRILREELGKGNDFAQKITYRTTGRKPEELLAEFRNSFNPRIAVTVDMIATGTDVKPLECLLFMRNVKSAGYFEQMKGRGVRVIDPDALRSVTPDAEAKTHFVIVDAIGVSEQDKTANKTLDRQPTVPLDKVMGLVAAGVANPDLVSTLASRLARLGRQLTEDQHQQVTQQAGGTDLRTLTASLLGSLDPDAQAGRARELFGLTQDQEPSESQLDQVQAKMMVEALKPLHDHKLRDLLLNLKKSHEQVIDEVSRDELIEAGFSATALEKARALITSFQDFIESHAEQGQVGVVFTAEQREWLDAIRDYIATSLRIEEDDFEYAPFNQVGGLGRVHELFGERLSVILDELNRRLAA